MKWKERDNVTSRMSGRIEKQQGDTGKVGTVG